MSLTARQKRVLSAVQLNAKAPLTAVADRLRMNFRTVRNTLDDLVVDGAIFPVARVQPAAMGLQKFFVWCELSSTGILREKRVVDYIEHSPQVSWLDTYHGDFHLLLGIYGQGRDSIKEYLTAITSSLGDVFESLIVMPERSWTVFERKLLMQQRPVSAKYIGRVTYTGFKDNWSKLDDKDLRLIEYLSHRPMDEINRIADALDMHRKSVGRRIAALTKREILLGTAYTLNRDLLGLGAGCYLLKLPYVDDNVIARVDEFCALDRNVWAFGVHGQGSQFDFAVAVEGSSQEELWSVRRRLLEYFEPTRLEYSMYRETRKSVADVWEYKAKVLNN